MEDALREQRNHFDDAQWAGFIRDTAAEAVSAAIRAHLEEGCAECSETYRVVSGLHRMGLEEAAHPLPEEILKRAQSIFRPEPDSRNWIEELRLVVASLVEEMRPGWAAEGVRSAGAPNQRMLFRAGDYSVDVNLDPCSESGRQEIVGQIANGRDSKENVEGIVVQLVSTGKTLGETSTNRFGEFVLECPSARAAMLRFALRANGERIELSLSPDKSRKR